MLSFARIYLESHAALQQNEGPIGLHKTTRPWRVRPLLQRYVGTLTHVVSLQQTWLLDRHKGDLRIDPGQPYVVDLGLFRINVKMTGGTDAI